MLLDCHLTAIIVKHCNIMKFFPKANALYDFEHNLLILILALTFYISQTNYCSKIRYIRTINTWSYTKVSNRLTNMLQHKWSLVNTRAIMFD